MGVKMIMKDTVDEFFHTCGLFVNKEKITGTH